MKKHYYIIFTEIIIFFFFPKLFSSQILAQEYCHQTDYGQVCFDLSFLGNSGQESMRNYWPLNIKTNWKMAGISDKYHESVPYKLQIIADRKSSYLNQEVTDVNFVKNRIEGYWGPYNDENFSWKVVNFGQSPWGYIWAVGGERFDRGKLPKIVIQTRQKYESLDDSYPPYVIFPGQIKANTENSGLENSLSMRMQYYYTNGDAWDFISYSGHSSWFNGIVNARIKVPYFGDQWVKSKKIEFVELSLPKGYEDGVNDPYSNDPELVCRYHNDVRYYRGVREDWFFVENTGPVLIITRDIGQDPDDECVYEVVRQDLRFENSDTFSFLVGKAEEGYDEQWDYPKQTPTSEPTFTPEPTSAPKPTSTPNYRNYLLYWGTDNDAFDENNDGLVNGLDFGILR